MNRRSRMLVAVVLCCLAPYAFAKGSDARSAQDSARPAIGEWVGGVSWNDPRVSYAWQVNRDGTFRSGRLGRGYTGGGSWGASGWRLTFKYNDGFRYEGELHDNAYSGVAYLTNGRPFGEFSMRRSAKQAYEDRRESE